MAGRIAPAPNPVTITFDGREMTASAGEPLVASLVAGGHVAFARSPKFHRPRGPACMRGACDGCLARVNGVPNVMTCLVEAHDGMVVDSQNTLGPRDLDLLRMTDWFFPKGMNHHELFAGVPGLQQVMQAFARRVAGLGKLPTPTGQPPTAPASAAPEGASPRLTRRAADVVVVGGGPSGLRVATELARRGREVELVDDAIAPGGGLVALGAGSEGEDDEGGALAAWGSFVDDARAAGVRFRPSTVAGAVYGDDLLVLGPGGAEVLNARAVVLAPGAHDGVLPFEGNDLPGVLSARGALFLLSAGVTVGDHVVVVVPPGGGPFGDVYARALARVAPNVRVELVHGTPERARGTGSVREAFVRPSDAAPGSKAKSLRADALIVDAPRAPAYELLAQCGAALAHHPSGFCAETDGGKIRDGFWGVGEAVGTAFEPAAIAEEAEAVAARISA